MRQRLTTARPGDQHWKQRGEALCGAWATLYSRPSRSSFTAASARLDVAAELLVLNVEDHWLYAVYNRFQNQLAITFLYTPILESLPDRIFLGAGPSLSPCLSDHSYKDTIKS